MRRLSTLANGAAFFALVPSLLAYFGEAWWRFHLWEHLRPQFGWCLMLALILAAAARRWRWAGFWFLAAAGNGLLLLPFLPLGGDRAELDGPPLRIAHCNLHVANPEPERLLEWLEGLDRDLVFLQEVTPEWQEELESGLSNYRLALCEARPNPTGIALLLPRSTPGRWQIRSSEILRMEGMWGYRPVIEMLLHFDDRELAVLSFHAARPVSGAESKVQLQDFSWAADWVLAQRATGRETVVVGDFNSTPWSSRFRRLRRAAGLENSLTGRGLQGSWPTRLPSGLRLPIDHALHSPGVVVRSRQLGPEVASDHLPLLLELGWPPAAEAGPGR